MRLFLLSTGLGVLLYQRRVTVLHGSSIATSRGAVVFAGASGSGKSTLAAAFYKRGFNILTDEICALTVSGDVSVLPGPTALMLWKDALQKLAIESAPLVPVRSEIQKYFLPLEASYRPDPLRLTKIYILESSPQNECSLVSLRGFEKFKALASNLYRPGLIAQMGLEGEFSGLIARLAAQTEVARVTRPQDGFTLDTLMDKLERDFA